MTSKLQIFSDIHESMFLNRLQGASYDDVKNGFFSNYLAALLLLKLQDLRGLMLINDPAHAKLTKFSDRMSDLNFWGRALFYPDDKDVKNRLAAGSAAVLAKEAGRVMDSRVQKMMKVPLTSPERVDWNDTVGALLLLKHRFSLQSSYFNNIAYALHKWDSLREGEKKRAINQALMYLMQSDPQSRLLSRVRALSMNTMLTGILDVAQKIISFTKLKEDDGGGDATGTGNIGGSQGATIDNMIVRGGVKGDSSVDNHTQDVQNMLGNLYTLKKKSPLQVTKKGKYIFKDGKIIKKKKKVFKVRKFKAPDYLRVKQ